MTFSKKTHTQKQGTLVHSDFNPLGAESETKEINEVDRAGPGSGSQTVTSFFTRKTSCLTTVLLHRFGTSASHGWEEPT